MGTAALVGVSLAAILLITLVTLVWVSRSRDETPEVRRRRARRDHEKSRRWLHGPAGGAGDGYSGCAGGSSGCSRGGSGCGGGGCGGGGGN